MPSAPFGNDLQKVEGYQRFWSRGEARRPLVGFTLRGFFPMEEYRVTRGWPTDTYLEPEMVDPEAFFEDEERLLAEGELLDDDILRGDMPAAAAIPWLSGMLGARLRILPGNVLGEERVLAWTEIERLRLDPDHPWYKKYFEFVGAMVTHSRGRYPVSHGSMIGPCDLLGEWRGHTQSVLDLLDEPERAMDALWRATGIFEEIHAQVWQAIPRFAGGYFDGMYQLWSPQPIARLQEDASGIYSPTLYRKFLQPLDRYLATRFANAFIHLHATSMFILDALLEIDELRCFEINKDAIGPPLVTLIPYFQMVQSAKRCLLIRGTFAADDIRLLMDALDPRGLYLFILVKDAHEAGRLRPLLGM